MPYKMKSPYGMMPNQQSKKSIHDGYGLKKGSTASKVAKGIRDFHIGAASFIGPGGIGKGLKSLAGAISKIKNPHTAKFAGKLLNFSKNFKPKDAPKFGSWSSKRGQRRPDGSRY